jgi:SAM-dependent methyltransferase
MAAPQQGQLTRTAADVYDELLVPALFAQWPPLIVQAAAIAPGQDVLDVACGTGVLACEAAAAVWPGGRVTGLDRNEAMLAVARRKAPDVEWRQGQAEALPFADARFDAVISQFGLMFFEARVTALAEMWRVLKPGGRLVVAVWDALERAPGYAALTALLQRLFGEQVADALRFPFALGDPAALADLAGRAGIPAAITTRTGTARFPSLEAWVETEAKGWVLGAMLDDDQHQQLRQEAMRALERFVQADGTVQFAASAHILCAAKA